MRIEDICSKNDNPNIPIEARILKIINELRWQDNYHLVHLLWCCKSNIEWLNTKSIKQEILILELEEKLLLIN